MKQLYIQDLERGMTIVSETFAIKEVTRAETKDKKPYYRLTLVDKTGEIGAQIWSDVFDQIEQKALKAGAVIMIDGLVDEYRGAKKITIQKATRVDESKLDEYMEGSSFSTEELWDSLQKFIAKIKNTQLQELLKAIFSDKFISSKFKYAPAAENVHHSFRGGLIEHVLEMLAMSEALEKHYPEADFDLVKTGIILHDIGKLYELQIDGMVVQRTTEGYLIGHLVKSFEIVLEFGKDILDPSILMQLKHIILSHHGELEYGSPVMPSTIEAGIVYVLDNASSKVRIFQKNLKTIASGEFTDWDRILRTKIYKSGPNTNVANDQSTISFT